MPRQELNSDTLPIEQRPPISDDPSQYDGDIITGEPIREVALGKKGLSPEYLAMLAFMEEPVTIRMEPSSEQNAATSHPFWCNGKPAEVFQNGCWQEIGYLPTGRELTIKRKILEIIIRAKKDTVHTRIQNPDSDQPNNTVDRYTTATHSFSIIEDRNPRGAAWVAEVRRRNL